MKPEILKLLNNEELFNLMLEKIEEIRNLMNITPETGNMRMHDRFEDMDQIRNLLKLRICA